MHGMEQGHQSSIRACKWEPHPVQPRPKNKQHGYVIIVFQTISPAAMPQEAQDTAIEEVDMEEEPEAAPLRGGAADADGAATAPPFRYVGDACRSQGHSELLEAGTAA